LVLKEYVNVPDGAARVRYTYIGTWGVGTTFTICNGGASAFLKSQCNATAAIGMNGNDAFELLRDEGSGSLTVLVRNLVWNLQASYKRRA
jgi:hypothetical protein